MVRLLLLPSVFALTLSCATPEAAPPAPPAAAAAPPVEPPEPAPKAEAPPAPVAPPPVVAAAPVKPVAPEKPGKPGKATKAGRAAPHPAPAAAVTPAAPVAAAPSSTVPAAPPPSTVPPAAPKLAPYNTSGEKPELPTEGCAKAAPPPALSRESVYKDAPFKAGEHAVYEVKYGGVLGGYGTMDVRPPVKIGDVWHQVFHAEARTGDWFKAVFIMEDQIQAVSRPWDFGIAQFYMKQDEGKLFSKPFVQEKWSDFDHAHCVVKERTKRQGKPEETQESFLVTGANDVIGAYFNLRSRHFVVGRTEYAPVFTSAKNWLLEAHPLAVESVTVGAGTFRAMKIRLKTYIGKELQQKGDVIIWIDVDRPAHPLVQVQAEIKIGSIWIELKEFRPGSRRMASWWQHAVVYQIYPRSFQDSDGDGVGDLRGIIRRLDYLVELGVNAAWISPFYPSPMKDFGYDIADYTGVDPLFGTLADFDELIAEAHKRGLRIILDLVPSHSSDAHPWFQRSRAAKDDPQRDWYIWRDPAPDGGPPNNWRSNFAGSAWTFDAATGQYYYHAFLPEQPDLNWRHDGVKAAIFAAMRFWLDRGVDGFRVDAVVHLVEDAAFRDEPPNPRYEPHMPEFKKLEHCRTIDLPETHAVVREMRALVDRYPGERILITEAYLPLDRQIAYYGQDGRKEAQLPFNFHLIKTAWRADAIAALVKDYEAMLPAGAWPNWVLGNHDVHRLATRLGDEQARIAAMLLLTLRGTPTLYYGDELGMRDADVPPHLVQDPAEKREPGKGLGRDPERSPMPWDGTKNAGFTDANPWLPLAPDHASCHVLAQRQASDSLLNLYKELLRLRAREAALSVGAYRLVEAGPVVLAFERFVPGSTMMVLLNFSDVAQRVALGARRGSVVLSTRPDRGGTLIAASFELKAHEGVICAL